jgi:hypothetical protein
LLTSLIGDLKMNTWVNIKDGIPENNEDDISVLVHFENGSIETVHMEYFTDVTCGLDDFENQLYCKRYEGHDPAFTHWMSLPEPPKAI